MKKILLDLNSGQTISINTLDYTVPIFAKCNNKLIGMIVEEPKGWILRIGKSKGLGYYSTLIKCLEYMSITYEYTFHIED